MSFSTSVTELIGAFQCFPGVGPRSAQRMAMHILLRERSAGERLVQALQNSLENIKYCEKCNTLTEKSICDICSDHTREKNQICVVHYPSDILSLEKTKTYRGYYFVLNGYLSPIDGIDGKKLSIPMLIDRLKENTIDELILATNNSPEGDMTAYYIQQHALSYTKNITRLAQGLPVGSEVEYIDNNTLGLAFNHRRTF